MPISSKQTKLEARPRPRPGEHVDGWVTGLITIRRLPRRMIKAAEEQVEINITPSFSVGYIPIYAPSKTYYTPAVYAPTTTQFVFALVEYPSGSIFQWGKAKWTDIDILWASDEFLDQRTSEEDEPRETPELRAIVEHIVQMAKRAGWAPAPHGKFWCNYVLCKRYDQVGVPLRWK